MENTENKAEKQENEAHDAVTQTGSITARSSRGVIHCITIIGQVEGHMELPAQTKTTKYEHIIPQITAVEEDEEIEGLLDSTRKTRDGVRLIDRGGKARLFDGRSGEPYPERRHALLKRWRAQPRRQRRDTTDID